MRIEQLLFFVETAKAGSINAASEKLHISQQSLNTTLKNLEKELGQALFHTSNRGISLTPQGELVIAAARDILARFDQLQRALDESLAPPPISGSLAIQTTPSMTEGLMPHILQNFSSHYPFVNVQLDEQDHLQIVRALESGDIDLGIFGLQHDLMNQLTKEFNASSPIRFVPLYQYKIVLGVGSQTPLAKYKSISLKSALRYPFVISLCGDLHENLTYRWLSLYGTPNIKFTTHSIQIYRNLIKEGKAVGLYLGKRHCGVNIPLEDDITLIPLRGDGGIATVGYLYNESLPLTSAMQALIDELITYCS